MKNAREIKLISFMIVFAMLLVHLPNVNALEQKVNEETTSVVKTIEVPMHSGNTTCQIAEKVHIDYNPVNTNSEIINVEKVVEIPLLNQHNYDDIPYGNYGTISSHGCGIVCLSMVASYLLDEPHSPITLAEMFGHYNTEVGSAWSLFEDSAIELGINFQERVYDWNTAKEALQNGQIVICSQKSGLFTKSGHFIVLTGINEDGKITVNDPNGYNWTKNQTLIDGFANGFDENDIYANACVYWIYEAKSCV